MIHVVSLSVFTVHWLASLLVLLLQNLAAQKSYNKLNMSMREALASRACCMEGVLKCYRHETLETVIDRIAKAEVKKKRRSLLNVSLWLQTSPNITHLIVSPAGSPLGAGGQPRRGERDRLSVRLAPSSGPLACRYWCSLLLIPSTLLPAPPPARPLPSLSFKHTWSSGWPEAPLR